MVIKEAFGWRKSTIPHNHSCSAFLHVSYSFLRRNFDSQAPDFPHTDACIHAFLLQVMYQLHGIAPSPRFCFSSHVSTTRHDLSCLVSPPIHVSHTRPYAPSLSPSSSCIKSSVQRLIEEIQADGHKAPNSYIVVRSLLYSHGLIASCDKVGRLDQVQKKYRQCRLGCRGRGQINR